MTCIRGQMPVLPAAPIRPSRTSCRISSRHDSGETSKPRLSPPRGPTPGSAVVVGPAGEAAMLLLGKGAKAKTPAPRLPHLYLLWY
jgi:hypothetical protein